MLKKIYFKFFSLSFFLSFLFYGNKIFAQCGVPPASGSVTISIANNVINSFYAGVGNPLAGGTSVTVSPVDARGNTTAIAAGDLVLIMQMQGADLNTNNGDDYGNNIAGAPASGYVASNLFAGYYEYNTVASVAGSTINLLYSLANNYYNRDFTSTSSIQRYQVIRVPRYYDFKIKSSASVTAPAWNGNTGGVVVIDVANTFTLIGQVDVRFKGFRGGGGKNFAGATAGNSNGTGPITNTDYRWNSPITNPANLTGGVKGESIAGSPAYYYDEGTSTTITGTVEGYIDGSMGRGAPGNGGGGGTDGEASSNQYNSGGGGGANGGDGGLGGSGWNGGGGDATTFPTGGYGGSSFLERSVQRFIMGGGGGAGSANNSIPSDEYYCSGGNGGGIVIIRAKMFAGTGSVLADGSNAPGVTDTFTPAQTDAAGGGGGGGTIIIVTTQNGPTGLASISASAKGGDGGDMTNYYDHGPGGGGGGGVIITNGGLLSSNVSGGLNGFTRTGSDTGPIDNSYGATGGSAGVLISLTYPPPLVNSGDLSSPCGALPVTLTNFAARWNNNTVDLQWQITNEINLSSFELEYSNDGIHFSKLATLPYHSSVTNYTYSHLTPSVKNFYRLKMIDADGKFFYSKVLSVHRSISGAKVVVIYPNPAYSDLTLQVITRSEEKLFVKIFDNSGRLVLNKNYTVPSGQNYISIDGIDKLPASNYVVTVKSQSIDAVEKLIVGKR